MGEVYAAVDQLLQTPVAIKTLNAALISNARAVSRLRREALLARRVTHPSVCRIFDVGTEGEPAFLTMELLEGETLGARLRREGRLSIDVVLCVAEQLGAALDAAHRVGVIHRDLKPDNVMLLDGPEPHQPRAFITDFGLARLEATAEKSAAEGGGPSGRLAGTLSYMAPEQIEGSRVTAAADIYALGLVLYQMTTGRLPFEGPTPLAGALRRLRESPPSPGSLAPVLPPHWNAAILRCLQRNPGDRFTSAKDLLRALTTPATEAALPATRQRFMKTVGLGLLVSIVLLGFAATASYRDKPVVRVAESTAVYPAPQPAVNSPETSARPDEREPRPSQVGEYVSPRPRRPLGTRIKAPRREFVADNTAARSPAAVVQIQSAPKSSIPEVSLSSTPENDELLDPRTEEELLDPYRWSEP
jgi:serine/threonine protein kinase